MIVFCGHAYDVIAATAARWEEALAVGMRVDHVTSRLFQFRLSLGDDPLRNDF